MTAARYLEIADELAAELAGAPAGSRIDGEHGIGRRFGVGRAAARAALQELERRLLVRRVQGAGTFVNRRIDYTISHDRRPSWHETVTAAGAHPRTVVRGIETRPLPAEHARALDLPAGTPCHRLVRQSYIDDLLAARVHEWVPVSLVAHLDLAVHAAESLDLVLRQVARVEPVRAWCRVSLDVPPPAVCAGLEIEPSRPVWLVESVSRDARAGAPSCAAGPGCARTRSGWWSSWARPLERRPMEFSREERTALLAVAGREELVGLADACLADGAPPRVLRAPEAGCVATEVTEPIAGERFLLGDVLAVQAEVELGGSRGWAMRLGDDRAAALAAAICDAEVQAGRPRAGDVLALCGRVAQRSAAAEAAEWARLAPTVVEFEELT